MNTETRRHKEFCITYYLYPYTLYPSMLSHSTLHYSLIDHIIRKGYAPSLNELVDMHSSQEEEMKKALIALQDYHGVVLHPNAPKVWAIHPFSLAPTAFSVHGRNHTWWGNCAWCSLGVAAIVGEDVLIKSSSGAQGEPIDITVTNGQLDKSDLLIHFPIPMTQAWDNVVYTCSTMLFFQSEKEIDTWVQQHQIPKGDVQRLGDFWPFAKKWYGKHADPNWVKWTQEEAKHLFQEFGLTHPVWQLEGKGERF